MHELTDISMICADTTRSRAYLQNMTRAGLRPAHVLLMAKPEHDMPGQSLEPVPAAPRYPKEDDLWQQAHFNPNATLEEDIAKSAAPVTIIERTNINDADVVAAITDLPGDTVIYSGFGGQILRAAVLATGKQFLHVHGGYLPDYRGSTTNYYSMITENTLGASAIFLTPEIDAGPILMRRRFAVPRDRMQIDHLHDSAARAVVLCDVLRTYAKNGEWPQLDMAPQSTAKTYYVVHPMLKHIAIFGKAQN